MIGVRSWSISDLLQLDFKELIFNLKIIALALPANACRCELNSNKNIGAL